ncbi:MAG: hypothetical protein ACREEW_04620 [Caulobacteraceae bacterium]
MRLRQVALIARKIAPVADQLAAVFDIKDGFRDPGVEVFGLRNAVMPMGGEFLEVLEPMRDGTAGGRYLDRRGGDVGYMVILHAGDALAERARLEAMGVRVVATSPKGRYCFTHFHPADCAGVLLSIEGVEGDADWAAPMSEWPAAGPDWRQRAAPDLVGISAVTLQSHDPLGACQRWCELLGRGAVTAGDGLSIALDRGAIRFVAPIDDHGAGVVGFDIEVRDARAALERARAAGLAVAGGAVEIGGVVIRPVSV